MDAEEGEEVGYILDASSALAELWHEDSLTDIELVPESGPSLRGHRVVLAAQSPFFR